MLLFSYKFTIICLFQNPSEITYSLNSTLTLNETEKILLVMEISRHVSLREVFEAKNLARVMEYTRKKAQQRNLSIQLILFLHEMLVSTINDKISGRFRSKGEYVRVGLHIAPAPALLNAAKRQNIPAFRERGVWKIGI